MTSDNHAESLRENHPPSRTSPSPNNSIKLPINGMGTAFGEWITAATPATIKNAQNANQTIMKIFTNQFIVKRPVRTTLSPRCSKRPTKNGLKELPTIGMTRWSETREA